MCLSHAVRLGGPQPRGLKEARLQVPECVTAPSMTLGNWPFSSMGSRLLMRQILPPGRPLDNSLSISHPQILTTRSMKMELPFCPFRR